MVGEVPSGKGFVAGIGVVSKKFSDFRTARTGWEIDGEDSKDRSGPFFAHVDCHGASRDDDALGDHLETTGDDDGEHLWGARPVL